MFRRESLMLLGLLLFQNANSGYVESTENYDEWAIEISRQDKMTELAKRVAAKHNLEFVRVVSNQHMPEFFHLRAKTNTVDINSVTEALQSDPLVVYAAFQVPHETDKKTFNEVRILDSGAKTIFDPKCHCHVNYANGDTMISKDVFQTMNGKRINLTVATMFNDDRWLCQWQLYNCGQTGGPNEYDLDITKVWQKGITGMGIIVSIVDDGVEYTHDEIAPNYDREASRDFVDYPDFDGPLPNPGISHGTKCAGVVGMAANNSFCGVGAAYDANIGAIRIIGARSTDAREAAGLIYNANYIDIYSNSWGPSDTGKLYRQPPRLTATALERACENGREGKGNIYPLASGNGGLKDDHCGADGFSCSIYTIAIAASSSNGLNVDYSEQCTCIMVTVPSTDSHVRLQRDVQEMIVPNLNNKCSDNFRGTSSVTPLASAVFALALQANPNLTWRDMQYLIAETALVVDPESKNWQINGAGYHVHPYYGFGALNALHLVTAGEYWKNVDNQRKCNLRFPKPFRAIPSGGTLVLRGLADGCQDRENQVLKLEHVQAILSYSVKCRGDISVRLISPCGTVSQLMNTRSRDDLTTVTHWPYMSVFHWGEDPRGTWTLEITDNKGAVFSCTRSGSEESAGHMWEYELILWGVNEQGRRRMEYPVCDKKHVYDYLYQENKKDRHFSKIIEGETEAKIPNLIYDEFIEDFSEKAQYLELQSLRQRPPAPRKTMPFTVPFQKIAMNAWKSTLKGPKSRSRALAKFIARDVIPAKGRFTARHFDAVRRVIAGRLLSSADIRNDDGEPTSRDDLIHLADALMKFGRKPRSFSASRRNVALILLNVANIWDL